MSGLTRVFGNWSFRLFVSTRASLMRLIAVLCDCFPVHTLELFSREARPGWSVWGNEVGKFASCLAGNMKVRRQSE